jgi:ribonucleoside-triphosphate reductase (thioredoxin)
VLVQHRFNLDDKVQDHLRSLVPPFGYNGFGEFIFYRTYSRTKEDGGQEDWADVVIRVTNGTFSIRKDWYLKTGIHWDEAFWQEYAKGFAEFMFKMKWMPPGRGLWAMGSNFVYERGSMALNNCAYTDINSDTIAEDIGWLMDSLMHGVGVGFGPVRDGKLKVYEPVGTYIHVIPDTREGWVESEMALINAFTKPNQPLPIFDYSLVREAGLPIKGFGGISSGPGPLKDLHERTIAEFRRYLTRPQYDEIYLKTNLANHVGCCVVAGNVRRSAELCKGKLTDPVFPDLKDYAKYPEREAFGWMSNNSVELETDEDFQMLGEIARRVIKNGEPGYINRRTMPYARLNGKRKKYRKDKATGINPCGEMPQEHRETCNVVETLPTMCDSHEEWLMACEYATVYASTVSLLPTHQPSTNKVVARNRRIGVSIIDFSGWQLAEGVYKVTQYMREGYKRIRKINKWVNQEAGVPISIRVTTIKPGGTGPKLPGKTAGIGNPTFDYTIRRVRVAKNSPVHPLLVEANVPYEQDFFDPYTDVFEYPILQGPAKPADKVTLWQQAMTLMLVQREWADNAVSNTLYFKPMWPLIENLTLVSQGKFRDKIVEYVGHVALSYILSEGKTEYLVPERYKLLIKYSSEGITELNIHEYDATHEENDIEPVLSMIAPATKSVSLLPHSAKGAYRQMPEEGITRAEYERRLAQITPIDWSQLSGSDGIDEKYCSGPTCELPAMVRS